MGKLLSIIVPSYNMAKYLRGCLDSLLVSDTSLIDLLDVVVVNDGSTDSTSSIANSFAERFPASFRVVDKINGHYGSCINVALPLVRGKYVRLLDADDTFETVEFERYLIGLKKLGELDSPPDLVLSDVKLVDESGETIPDDLYVRYARPGVFCLDDDAIFQLRDLGMPQVTYRTAVFEGLNFRQLEGLSYTDTQWVTIPMLGVSRCSRLEYDVYRYLRGRVDQSMSAENVAKYQIPAMMRISLDSLRQYQQVGNVAATDMSRKFVRNRIFSMMKGIYEWALLTSELGKYDGMLAQYDEDIKNASVEMYNELGALSIGSLRVPYIRIWRRNRSSRSFAFKTVVMARKVSRILKA